MNRDHYRSTKDAESGPRADYNTEVINAAAAYNAYSVLGNMFTGGQGSDARRAAEAEFDKREREAIRLGEQISEDYKETVALIRKVAFEQLLHELDFYRNRLDLYR